MLAPHAHLFRHCAGVDGSGRPPGLGLYLSANPVIAVDGDEATVESYVVVISGADEPALRLAGRYEDRLRRVGGAWKFARRELHPQFVKRS